MELVSIELVFTQILNGISLGMIYALMSLGLSLIYGLIGVVNFAHGAFFMLGAYFVWQFMEWGISYWLAMILAAGLVGLIGLLIEPTIARRTYGEDLSKSLVVFFGLLIFLIQSARFQWGALGKMFYIPNFLDFQINLGFTTYSFFRIFIIVFTSMVVIAVYFFLEKTQLGLIIRAGIQNREMVQALGINIYRMFTLVFVLGVILAAVAGIVSAPIISVRPEMGIDIQIVAFVVVVLGGMGSFLGSVVSGIIIGEASALIFLFEPRYSQLIIYVIMTMSLTFKESGLFGEVER